MDVKLIKLINNVESASKRAENHDKLPKKPDFGKVLKTSINSGEKLNRAVNQQNANSGSAKNDETAVASIDTETERSTESEEYRQLISGLSAGIGEYLHSMSVVPEDKLENFKSMLNELNSTENVLPLFNELKRLSDREAVQKLLEYMIPTESEDYSLYDLMSKLPASMSTEDENPIINDLRSLKEKIHPILKEVPIKQLLKTTETDEKLPEFSNQMATEKNVMVEVKAQVKVQGVKSGHITEASSEMLVIQKEEKVLKSIMGDQEESRYKAFSVPLHLNKQLQNIEATQELSNAPVVNKNSFNVDMIKAVKYMELNNIKELTVNIAPKELGQIAIRVTMEAGIMRASLSAANKETLSLLHSNAAELKNSLNDSGIKVQEVSINIYNEDTTFFSNSFGSRSENSARDQRESGSKSQVHRKDAKDIDEGQSPLTMDNNISILA
jgi:flagellar hook-length control protein FliK